MTQYLRLDADNKSHWHITENCNNLITEMTGLHWKTWANRTNEYANNKHEKIAKKDDHACDSSRYFFTLLPDLTPVESNHTAISSAKLRGAIGPTVVASPVTGSWDTLLAMRTKQDAYEGSQGDSGEGQKWNIQQSTDLSGLEYD